MQRSALPAFLPVAALLLFGLLLPACGDDGTYARRRLGMGPPLIERAVALEGEDAILIQGRGPCMLVLYGEGLGGDLPLRELSRRTLPAGRSVTLSWSFATEDRPAEPGSPTPKDQAEGRTEPRGIGVTWTWGDAGASGARNIVWARPGLAKEWRHATPPPARPEPLGFGTAMELGVIAITDMRGKGIDVKQALPVTKILFVDPEPGDRISPVRLLLSVESP